MLRKWILPSVSVSVTGIDICKWLHIRGKPICKGIVSTKEWGVSAAQVVAIHNQHPSRKLQELIRTYAWQVLFSSTKYSFLILSMTVGCSFTSLIYMMYNFWRDKVEPTLQERKSWPVQTMRSMIQYLLNWGLHQKENKVVLRNELTNINYQKKLTKTK